ncbi:MAG: hypothetical protein WCX48_03865 [Bacteroidales bacterium]
MNEIFSSNRFFKLLKKEVTERAPMIIRIAGIFSLILAGSLLNVIFDGGPLSIASRNSYLLFATFITMVIAPFNLYKNYNHPKKGIDYVLLPASVTEKFLSMLTNTVIILPLITFFSVLLTDTILSTISPSMFPGYLVSSLWSTGKLFENVAEALIFQQGCILGNFLFKKNKIFKTMLSGAGLYVILALIIMLLFTVFFKEQLGDLNNMNMHISIGCNSLSDLGKLENTGGMGGLLKGLYYFVIIVFYVIFPAGFLTGTFYKMKTQQY